MNMQYKKIVLPVGSQKTGSSSIQFALHRQRDSLLQAGCYYPSSGPCHLFLESIFSETPATLGFNIQQGRTSPAALKRYHEQTASEITSPPQYCETLVLSNERLPALSSRSIYSMAKFLKQFSSDVQVFCYLRDPFDQIISAQKQLIKSGSTTLDTPTLNEVFLPSVDLKKFHNAFGEANVNLRYYGSCMANEGGIVRDFCDWVGINLDLLEADVGTKENLTQSHEATLLMDALNSVYPTVVNGKENPDRARYSSLSKVKGQRANFNDVWQLELHTVIEREREFVSHLLQVDIADHPSSEALDVNRLWGPECLASIATLINSLDMDVQFLQANNHYKNAIISDLKGLHAQVEADLKRCLGLFPLHQRAFAMLARHYLSANRLEALIQAWDSVSAYAIELEFYRALFTELDREYPGLVLPVI